PNNFRFPWGNEINGSYANYFKSGDPFEPGSTPVGFFDGSIQDTFQTSKAESYYGCYDMAGNAWEWTRQPWNSETPYHKGKGGGFNYHSSAHVQVYYHSSYGPSVRPPLDMCNVSDGFRVVFKTSRA
ncbi:MAG: Sulfatase-modifying factor enzyme 1, partial [Bacteroidota bacterium]